MTKPYQLVNRVFTKIKLQTANSHSTHFSKSPTITIARDPGSGGKHIAKKVAKKLKFSYYDEALIEAISKSAKKRKNIIKNIDERTRNIIQDTIHSLFNPEYVSDTLYINHLTNVVLAIAHQGKAVILGRGSNLIVPKDSSLRVYITAPKRIRIARAIEHENISVFQAQKRVEKITAQRKQFVSQYFNKNYTNAKYYDLIINSEYFKIHQVTDIVIRAFRRKFPRLHERVASTLSST